MTDQPFLILAPIRGITDHIFRTLFQRHFGGTDQAIAPFINPQPHANFDARQLHDLLPENNVDLPVIPQFLHPDPDGLLALARGLHDLGYTEINWNLGCPAPMVTRKRRGSGLLPHPEAILALLDFVLPRIPLRLSIKTRLGLNHPDELTTLLPLLNDYPLTEIIIHARLGKQLYTGSADPDHFGHCLALSRHPLVYNGDITTPAIMARLQAQFPGLRKWMIGRGLLADPFLALTIKGHHPSPEQRRARLKAFHQELFTTYQNHLNGPGHLLGRMKQLWFYLAASFPEQQKLWKRIKKTSTVEQYGAIIDQLFQS